MNTALHTTPNFDTTLAAFPALAKRWPGGPWTWDERFSCSVAVVRDEACDEVLELLRSTTGTEVDGTNQDRMPEALARVVARTGGLRYGQRAFFDELPGGRVRFALWWPWGDASAVSVRIGITD
jgi:hypothetical protein